MIYDSSTGFSNLREIVRKTTEGLKPYKKEFDAIVVRGVSGLVVGSPVSLRLNRQLIVVRKPGENSHCIREVEGIDYAGPPLRWIILDDFSATGNTIKRIEEDMQRFIDSHLPLVTRNDYKHVGSYFYDDYRSMSGYCPTAKEARVLQRRSFAPCYCDTVYKRLADRED